MRHIGHKVTAHVVSLGECGDVTGEQELLTIAVGVQLHRQPKQLADRCSASIHLHFMVMVRLLEVA